MIYFAIDSIQRQKNTTNVDLHRRLSKEMPAGWDAARVSEERLLLWRGWREDRVLHSGPTGLMLRTERRWDDVSLLT